MGYALVTLGIYLLGRLYDSLFDSKVKYKVVRGQPLGPPRRNGPKPKTGRWVRLGADWLDEGFGVLGVLIAGIPGAGKGLLIKVLLRSILNLMDGRGVHRVVIFDIAREMPRFVSAFAPAHVNIWILDPFDARCTAIDYARMLRTAADFLNFATRMVPSTPRNPQPFFEDSARLLFMRTLQLLNHCSPGNWELIDPCKILRNKALARALFQRFPAFSDAITHLTDNDAARSVYATLLAKLGPLEPAFACLAKAKEKRTVEEFMASEDVWLMGMDDRNAEACATLYAHLFDAFTDRALSQVTFDQKHWLFLDELRALRPLQCVTKVATRGRKSGCCMVSTIHDRFGMYHVYTRDVAEELFACHAYHLYLRLGSPDMSSWASANLGECDCIERLTTKSGHVHETVTRRRNVSPSELENLPPADYAGDLVSGAVRTPDPNLPPAFFTCTFRDDVDIPNDGRPLMKNFVPRPASDQDVEAFTLDDLMRLNLPDTPEIRKTIKDDHKTP
jgi:hypothetical protein